MSNFFLVAAAAATTLTTVLMSTTAQAEAATQTITFQSEGATLSGTLYLPDGFDGTATDAVIVTGAWTSVQEQMPSAYAHAMAERGLIAFTFDFRGWGKSADLPGGQRFIEDPAAKTEDIQAAIEYVAAMPEVARVHGLGICASAGYMLDATRGNDAVSRVGLVAPWLQDRAIVEAVYGGAEGVAGLISLAGEAEAKGGDIIPAAGPEGAEGVLMPIGGYYFDPKRGAIPQYDNAWNNAGWDDWLNYHPLDRASAYDKPLAIVHSDAAAIPEGARSFVQKITGEATQAWLEEVTQFDFYDDPAAVKAAADEIAAHLSR
ncbi:MAG: alpha/beta hydrolase [Pseudomonadota bacterium]